MSHPESNERHLAEKHLDSSRFEDTLEDAEHLLKYAFAVKGRAYVKVCCP